MEKGVYKLGCFFILFLLKIRQRNLKFGGDCLKLCLFRQYRSKYLEQSNQQTLISSVK